MPIKAELKLGLVKEYIMQVRYFIDKICLWQKLNVSKSELFFLTKLLRGCSNLAVNSM